ncbi:hypothetical protein C8Q77DRAFT_1157191 [Trametes polyzona]|nr:hypothetical protein C8Q77DRAFT_1157191 [Trametes polyzona]
MSEEVLERGDDAGTCPSLGPRRHRHAVACTSPPRRQVDHPPSMRRRKSTFRSLPILCCILLSATTTTAQASDPVHFSTIPHLIQCSPTTISWMDSEAPYILTISSFGEPGTSLAPLIDSIQRFSVSTTNFTWNTGFSAGTPVFFEVSDNSGALDTADDHIIQPGESDACLPVAVPDISLNVTFPEKGAEATVLALGKCFKTMTDE